MEKKITNILEYYHRQEMHLLKGVEDIRQYRASAIKDLADACILTKEMLLEELHRLMSFDGKIESVFWAQFTPYFNDGDPCVFQVGNVFVNYEGFLGETLVHESSENPLERRIAKLLKMKELEPLLYDTFGDNNEIKISKNGDVESNEFSDF